MHRRSFVVASSLLLSLFTSLAARGLTADERALLERRLAAQRVLAEQQGRPSPPELVWAEELEGRAAPPAGEAATWLAQQAPTVAGGKADATTTLPRLSAAAEQRARWARAADSRAVASTIGGQRVGAGGGRATAAATGTAALSGRVVRGADGSGVADVDVYLTDVAGVDSRATKADATGAFSFEGVAAGRYWLSAPGDDFLAGALYGEGPCPGNRCSFGPGNAFDVTEGASLSGYDLELLAAGVIVGSVMRAGSESLPAEGLFVQAVAFQPDGRIWQNYAYTDAAGGFRLPGTPAGAWIVATDGDPASVGEAWPDISCPGGGCAYDSATPAGAEVVAGQVSGGFDFVLEDGHGITGLVTRRADGTPLADIAIDIYSPGFRKYLCSGTTAADGTYRSCALPAGDYVAQAYTFDHFVYQLYRDRDCAGYLTCFGTADPISVAADADAISIDFALTDPAAIGGRVTRAADGDAVAGGLVRVYTGAGLFVDYRYVDAEGGYELATLGPGAYFVTAEDPTGELVAEVYDDHVCAPSCDVTQGDAITVASNERAAADFVLAGPAHLGGTLRGVSSDGSEPLAGATVSLWSAVTHTALASTSTAADGTWALEYPAGSFLLSFAKVGYRGEAFDGIPCAASCDLGRATVIEVAPGGARNDLDATLELGGVLAGAVTVKSSGATVHKARADVYRAVSAEAYVFVTSTSTDGRGRWRVTGLIPGTYKVRLFPGLKYRPLLYEASSCDFGRCSLLDGVAIELGDLEQRTDIDMAVARAVVLEGQVRSEATGRPIKGGSVSLRDLDREAVVFGSIGERGAFRVGSLPPGRYRLTAAASSDLLLGEAWPNAVCPQHACVDSGDILELAEAGLHSGYDFTLGPAAVISGRVVDASTGEGLANAVVVGLDQRFWNWPSFVVTNGDGRFRLGGLAPAPILVGTLTSSKLYGANFGQAASYYVDELAGDKTCTEFGCDPRPATVLEPAVGNQEITLALSRGATVSGTLTDANGPVAGTVDLLDLSGSARPAPSATVAADGTWRMQGVPPGRYFLHASYRGTGRLYPDLECGLASCDLTQGEAIEVREEDVSGLAIEASNPAVGSLSVRVEVGAHGRPRGGAVVEIYDSAGSRVTSGRSRLTGDSLGVLALTLAPGDYYLRASTPGYVPIVYPDVPCPGSCDVRLGQHVHVAAAPEPPTMATIRLTTAEVVLAGRVTDVDGHPLPGLAVGGHSSLGTVYGSGAVEWDGSFRIDGLPAGSLLQSITWGGGDWIPEAREDVYCSRDVCDWSAATAVEAEPGDEIGDLDFILESGGSLGGRVLDAATGLPLGGVEVNVRTPAGKLVSGPFSNSDGSWRTIGLPAGSYFVRTVGTVGYVDATLGDAACDPDCPADQGDEVVVTEPGRRDGFDLSLARD